MSRVIILLTMVFFSLSAWADNNWQFSFEKEPYPAYTLTANGSDEVSFKMNCFDAGINFSLKRPTYPVAMRWMTDQSITVLFNQKDELVVPITLGTNRDTAIVWVGANLFEKAENKTPLADETLPKLSLFLSKLSQTTNSDMLTFKLPTSKGDILTSEFSASGARSALIQFSAVCPNFTKIMALNLSNETK